MEESVPALADMLEAAMTSADLLEAAKTSANVVEAILNLVDMVEVILSPNKTQRRLCLTCMNAIQLLVFLQSLIINHFKTCIFCLCHMLCYCFCLCDCLFSPLGGTPTSVMVLLLRPILDIEERGLIQALSGSQPNLLSQEFIAAE
jgi:hypothetical protein